MLAKFLAPPGRLADLLAITGDKADGIRGAEGYGPVTAAKVCVIPGGVVRNVSPSSEGMIEIYPLPGVVIRSRHVIDWPVRKYEEPSSMRWAVLTRSPYAYLTSTISF